MATYRRVAQSDSTGSNTVVSADGWKVSLFEIGDVQTCLYSYFCLPCAIGTSRQKLDESNVFVNCLCLSPAALRWMTRTAYDFPGDAHNDCWTGGFLPCCTVNQVLQTVNTRGKVTIESVGAEYNKQDRIGFTSRPAYPDLLYACAYSFFCNRCAVGLASTSIGMPCWFGTLCMTSVSLNSAMRYHYNLKPFANQEVFLDGFLPACLLLCNGSTGGWSSFAMHGSYAFADLAEANARHTPRSGCYGCDLFGCANYFCDYVSRGGVCSEVEGKYLHRQQFQQCQQQLQEPQIVYPVAVSASAYPGPGTYALPSTGSHHAVPAIVQSPMTLTSTNYPNNYSYPATPNTQQPGVMMTTFSSNPSYRPELK